MVKIWAAPSNLLQVKCIVSAELHLWCSFLRHMRSARPNDAFIVAMSETNGRELSPLTCW
ncbi:MAG: hypothetical protein ACP5KJ_01780 [Candidatus Micrarchaeia archaeon]